jgi:D-alanyl-D-alanine carboxypeptidase
MVRKMVVGGITLILLVVVGIWGYLTLVPADTRLRIALGIAVPKEYATVFEAVTPTQHWLVAQGNVAQGSAEAITGESRFRIASTSKTFVAVVVLQLVEEGILGLDDLASQWLPPDIVANLPNAKRVTLRHLLQMRSGIPEYLEQPFFDAIAQDPFRAAPYTPTDVLAFAYDKAAYFEPGTEFRYTNSNYILLQLVIEAATGAPLHEAVRERILGPLGMSNTYTQFHEALPGGFVHGYSGYKQDGSVVDVTDYNDGGGLGDGALVSTSGDLLRFYQALFQEKTLLSDDLLAQMLDFQETGVPDSRYGLGVSEMGTPWGKFYGHTGGVYGYGSLAFYNPERQVIVVSLVATDTANGLIAVFGGLQAILGMP